MRTLVRLAMFSVLAIGCGSPKAGDACNNPACVGKSTLLRCESGVFQQLGCPGPQGCQEGGTAGNLLVVCDLTGTDAGAPCTPGMSGVTLCESVATALVCTNATFVQTGCSTTCVTSQPDGTGGACR